MRNIDGKSQTPLIVLAAVLLVVAGGVSWFGTRGGTQDSGVSSGHQEGDRQKETLPASLKLDDNLSKRGAAVNQQSCAGCHALSVRLVGPSYSEITSHFSNKTNDQRESLEELAFAVTHSAGSWAHYEQGPQLNLPAEDRIAVAYWILRTTPATQPH